MKTQREDIPPRGNDGDPVKAAREDEPSPEAKELNELKDRHLRLAADFDNFRKRTNQESARRAAAQKEALIRELLPILDNLQRAALSTASGPCEQLAEGVQMTVQQLNQLLRRHGIEREDSQGQQFDPNRHEALAIRKDETQPDHVVLETFEQGYRRGTEVFRPAKVVVNELAEHHQQG
jgi:molecular chaperone GrpE